MLRSGWNVEVFTSPEEADASAREENLRRTGIERVRILTYISNPAAVRSNRSHWTYEVLEIPLP